MLDRDRAIVRLDEDRWPETDCTELSQRNLGVFIQLWKCEIERVRRRNGDSLSEYEGNANKCRTEGRCEARGPGSSGGSSPDRNRGQAHHRRGGLRQQPELRQRDRKHDPRRQARPSPRRGHRRQQEPKSFHFFSPERDERGDRKCENTGRRDPIRPESRMPRAESPRLSPPPAQRQNDVSDQHRQPEKRPEPRCHPSGERFGLRAASLLPETLMSVQWCPFVAISTCGPLSDQCRMPSWYFSVTGVSTTLSST